MRATVSTTGSDVFYLEVRGFLEGVEVPLLGVTLAYGVDTTPMATLTIPASHIVRDLPETCKVHIIFRDLVGDPAKDSKQLWRLLFDGELLGYSYSTDTNGASISVTAVHTTGYLSLMQLLSLDITAHIQNMGQTNMAGDATILSFGAVNRVGSTILAFLEKNKSSLKSMADLVYLLVKAVMKEVSTSDVGCYYNDKLGEGAGGYKILSRFYGISDTAKALDISKVGDAKWDQNKSGTGSQGSTNTKSGTTTSSSPYGATSGKSDYRDAGVNPDGRENSGPAPASQDGRLTRNNWDSQVFTPDQFKCKGDASDLGPEGIDATLVRRMEQVDAEVYQTYGAHLDPGSGYRSPTYNADIGGATYSQHMYGRACDFNAPGVPVGELADIVRKYNPDGGVGIYYYSDPPFVHMDTRGERADWDDL